MAQAFLLTVSDGVHAGTREDRSGAALERLLEARGFEVTRWVCPDEAPEIATAIREAVMSGVELVVTTGGTGLGPRDVTPQATAPLFDYEVPGLAEEMRRAGAASTPMATISRSQAGVSGRTLILNLPGSERGAVESLEAVLPVLDHALDLLRGHTEHS